MTAACDGLIRLAGAAIAASASIASRKRFIELPSVLFLDFKGLCQCSPVTVNLFYVHFGQRDFVAHFGQPAARLSFQVSV
jgi:hypothetical protein